MIKKGNTHSPAGFTLVELMIAVSILSIGLVLILRSFLNANNVLDLSRNRILSMKFLEAKMADLEVKDKEGEDLQPEMEKGEEMLGNRKASWRLEVSPVDIDDPAQELNEARYIVSWQEGGVSKEASLSTYVKKKE
ncbi:MAG: prepilin-type N-terminal cleavage/methylation domain-containing protein [Candidatus Omnitrophica bacterium]|nr:prepilin-type N-terminal cleavage/methylation domain-containing protein [Candidatus Omnitrophota bacterium]